MISPDLPVDADTITAIGALITEFCWRVDQGGGGAVAELFTEDGTIASPHFSEAGRERIRALFQARADSGERVSRHFWSNLRVGRDGESRYLATSYALTAVGPPPTPIVGGRMVLGVATDAIVVENGRPLFASRSLAVTFEGRIAPEEAA